MNLKHLTDRALLKDIKLLVTKERELTAKILHHFREIERRRLFSEAGHGSMFEYAVHELGYSEPAAARRIHSARLLEELPHLEKKIEAGALNLTHLSMAAHLFKREGIEDKEKKKKILETVENKSKRESEVFLQSFMTKSPEEAKKVSLHFNVKKETFEKFEELRGLLGHKSMSNDEIMDYLLTLVIEKVKRQKFKLTDRPKIKGTVLTSVSRNIPASVKRYVYFRDKGKCSKCGGKYKLEYDHVQPHSLGGTNGPENLRLMCFSCNQRLRHAASLKAVGRVT